ncbi:hypothetical protein LOK49_LG14G01355 [Camellia lanceoleosa]|uniref:Uncharacterized protein n=1 Tax=Camellia lanceoleosa TaxID=1840588 RepID=A0ACC0F9H7_9ERIC|nr:hypothetical protein LOK49_LG14G01355 [Camellia lanceoleosa]
MKLLFWNCRGTGNNTFKRNLKEILRIHKPDILVLMETKVSLSSMGMFFNNLGFTASTSVDPTGRAGGIWILWDNLTVNVRVSSANYQAIHATVHKESYDDWVLSAVYASPLLRNRDQLWGEMEAMAENMIAPWLVVGDFNDFATQGERRSFTPNNNMGRNNKFLERISNCNLMDLGCSGPKLTWTNNRQGMANTKERLDRALYNAAWSSLFPSCTVRNLPRTYSDHSPFVVFTEGV